MISQNFVRVLLYQSLPCNRTWHSTAQPQGKRDSLRYSFRGFSPCTASWLQSMKSRAGDLAEDSCSADGNQEAERRRSWEKQFPLPGHTPVTRPTSSQHMQLRTHEWTNPLICVAPHDPITHQQPHLWTDETVGEQLRYKTYHVL